MNSILIIDDTLSDCRYLSQLLNEKAYKVRALPNADLALKSIERHKPDLILLDINMPQMNGFDLCTYLKNQPRYETIPIIFLSASVSEEAIVKGFKLGAVDYIRKPFYPAEVYHRIEQQLKLIEHEKRLNEIISETLMGSLQSLLDILAPVDPVTYAKSNRMTRRLKRLTELLDCELSWELKSAGMLYYLDHFNPKATEQILIKTNIQHEVFKNIPGMDEVAKMLEKKQVFKPLDDMSPLERGCFYLGLLHRYDDLVERFTGVKVMMESLREEFGNPYVIEQLMAMHHEEIDHIGEEMPLNQLISGMIVMRDIETVNGVKLVCAGTELSGNTLVLLKKYTSYIEGNIVVAKPKK